jgi:hypothetical protein
MLAFSAIHIASGEKDHSPVTYWLVVAGFCAVVTVLAVTRLP